MQEELTLKELILAVQGYFRYFLRRWYWFIIGGLLFGGGFFYYAYSAPESYTAPLTFMLNDDKGSSAGAGAILGSLGLGGGGNGGNTTQKLLELAKSRKVLSQVLFDSVTINGKAQLVADHIIDIYDLHDKWEGNSTLEGFYFGSDMPGANDVAGNSVYKMLHNKLVAKDDGLVKLNADELSGVFDLNAKTLDPALSVALVKFIFRELSEFFVAASVSGKNETLMQLRERADSVRLELNLAESRLARFQDRSSQILMRQETVKGQELSRQVVILSTMYGEILKNKETAAFLLANEKPAFSLIDAPLEPLNAKKESWINALILGGVLGVILTAIILFFSKLIRDAVSE